MGKMIIVQIIQKRKNANTDLYPKHYWLQSMTLQNEPVTANETILKPVTQ